MPNDPGTKRSRPAPSHPSGFPVADDAPVFVAPAVDVRPSAPARSIPPPPPSNDPASAPSSKVPFHLPVPVEERTSARPPALEPESEPVSVPPDTLPPETVGPETIDWERISSTPLARRAPSADVWQAQGRAPHVDDPETAQEREALVRELRALGRVDEQPDRTAERSVTARAALARARALRFRLALLDAWPAAAPSTRSSGAGGSGAHAVGPGMARALHLDLVLDAMLLVGIADGAPARGEPRDPALPVVWVAASMLRAIRPDLPRMTLRDRGSAAIARLTVAGWSGALEAVARAAVATPPEARQLALELAARVAIAHPRSPASSALAGEGDEHRLAASKDLERALGLPAGSVDAAFETARRRR